MDNIEDHSDGGLLSPVFEIMLLVKRMYLTEGEEDERVNQCNVKKQELVDEGDP